MLDGLLNEGVFLLFAMLGLGMALGRISFFGLSLGSSGVLFVALLAGHYGYHIPNGVGTIGLVLFVYCVGIGAGGRFFSALVNQGNTLAKLSLLVVTIGAGLAYILGRWMGIPADLAVGLFAGALTSTPALAAATDFLGSAGGGIPIGYGITYPFGVIGVVLFVQLLPRILKVDLAQHGSELDRTQLQDDKILHVLMKVTNDQIVGQEINEYASSMLGCQITRKWKEERLEPLRHEDRFEMGMEVLVVGRQKQIDLASQILGKRVDRHYILDTDRERQQVHLTSKQFSGKALRDLRLLRDFGIVVSRVTRLGLTFVPTGDTVLDANDILTVVGEPKNLERFSEAAGHRSQSFNETDLLSLGVGLAIGILLGKVSISLPGGNSLSLGMAGGPLLAGLLLGHFGRVGKIVGHIPRPTRVLLQEFGLVLFLAEAGIRGGGALVETLQTYGLQLFFFGVVITVVPLLLSYFVAVKIMKLNLLEALGGICGGMTSTPALGVITAKTDSQAPVVSYATAYPVALILMTIFAKLLIQLLQAL